ncbi:LacI family transcriptional regulator [Alginatibacterium sediminis]|uniref:LacI family transcriptional regulator n=1 Tax=Alginatibacterium sediminis TaxID=2164068 RepID=A0A420E6M0_9ALTE|nr:LacI family DNA-binding transcriptional regulator [Alginatibacterium sediminis]RKF13633.1 LacI family transcriptional regulator [Alginatibacterium sediminis]
MRNKTPTLDDVAKLAGVSRITASRYFRQPEKLRSTTQAKVAKAIADLGFSPNLAASALAGQPSKMVLALVSALSNPLFASLVSAMQSKLAEHGLHLLIADTQYDPDQEFQLLLELLGRRPDGILLSTIFHSPKTHKLLLQSAIPVVEVWDYPDSGVAINSAVGFSNHEIGYIAAKHLCLGPNPKAVFCGANDERDEWRWRGFTQGCNELGAPPPQRYELPLLPDIAQGKTALKQLLANQHDFNAIFFTNDLPAIGAVQLANELGIQLPNQLRICGFGNTEFAAHLQPSLSSISVPIEQIGKQAVSELINMLNGKAPQMHKLPASLIQGQSS